ncbi:hypothetical protein PAECIP112173_04681 [Paenibacillus sp. JJ-100]|nr:hypothetical protein PAECIP112173_04681 [Paenibacillus sp. JJ-100]
MDYEEVNLTYNHNRWKEPNYSFLTPKLFKKSFKWQHPIMHRLVALLYAVENKSVHEKAMQLSNELFKQHIPNASPHLEDFLLFTSQLCSR